MNIEDEYSDEKYVVNIDKWFEFRSCHVLLQSLLLKGYSKISVNWLSQSSNKLFDLLLSPDPKEVSIVETTVLNVYRTYAQTIVVFVERGYYLLRRFLCGFHSYHGVSVILKFLEMHYTSNIKWTDTENKIVKEIFIPLLLDKFSYEYYVPLNRLLSVCYTHNSILGKIALKSLIIHWPVTCTEKTVCFIHHSQTITNALGSQQISCLVVPLFKKLIIAAKSENYKVVLAVYRLLSDASFVFDFMSIAGSYIRMLKDILQESSNHWSKEVRETGKQVLIRISNSAPQLSQIPLPVEKESKSKEIWTIIAEKSGLELPESFVCN
jgi:hypothetical protein